MPFIMGLLACMLVSFHALPLRPPKATLKYSTIHLGTVPNCLQTQTGEMTQSASLVI